MSSTVYRDEQANPVADRPGMARAAGPQGQLSAAFGHPKSRTL
jgi:hypothetical protein